MSMGVALGQVRRIIIFGLALAVLILGAVRNAEAFVLCVDPIVTSISPTSGPATGGTSVTIKGLFFGVGVVAVTFGSTPATSFTVNSATQITATSPPGTGTVDVTVTKVVCTNVVTSATSAADRFTYVPLNSQKSRALQISITPIVAQTSGQAISSAIDGATDDAFCEAPTRGPNSPNSRSSRNPPDCRPLTLGPSGVRFNFANFAAEPTPNSRVDEAFSALGYAPIAKKAPPMPIMQREWSLWLDIHGTGWKVSDVVSNNATGGQTTSNLTGSQVNVTAGLGRKLTPDMLVGLILGYESFNYDVASLGGGLKGHGETVGGYFARRSDNLRFDAALAWSSMSYDVIAGTATGSIPGSRWLLTTGLTGSYKFGVLMLEPSLKVFALWEHEQSWTDSLGTVQGARDFSTGRASAGSKIAQPFELPGGVTLVPYAGLYGDYYFMADNAAPVAGQPGDIITTGWSARVTSGVTFTTVRGASINFGGEYGGIGARYKLWTGLIRGTMPF